MLLEGSFPESAGFLGRVLGVCAVFYPLFLCRMLGAGDIKLMAVCAGYLGLWDGIFVLFLGLFLGALRAAWILLKQEILWERMNRLGRFVVRSGLEGKLMEYPGRLEEGSLLRLGPYLFAGYCLFLIFGRSL